MRKLLTRLHQASAIISGILLVLVAVLTLVQIGTRLAGLPAHSWDEVATYCMAGSTFTGLAYAWRDGAHIRMDLVIAQFHGVSRRILEALALLVMLTVTIYIAWHTTDMTIVSWQTNDVSQGLLPIPLWIPQSAMALGSVMLMLAIAESLFDALFTAAPVAGSAIANSSPNKDVLARASREL
jgi:TRAP-type C4-dicarboxylate transport system permease small subunit